MEKKGEEETQAKMKEKKERKTNGENKKNRIT